MSAPIPAFFPEPVQQAFAELEKLPREEACRKAAATVGATLCVLGMEAASNGDARKAIAYTVMSDMLDRFCSAPFTPRL